MLSIGAAIAAAGMANEQPTSLNSGRNVNVSPQLSEQALSEAGQNGKRFFGPFENQPASLSFKNLPDHEWISLRFDLYLKGSWDGSSRVWGPDLWSLSVRGGQRLIFSSFCTLGMYVNNNKQSFPDDYPTAVYPAWNGVTKRGAIIPPSAESNGDVPSMDGVYHFDLVFPHSASEITLDFAGMFSDAEHDQYWGVGNLEVRHLNAAPTSDPSVLPQLWEDLASKDSMAAHAAIWKFIGAGRDAVDFLAEKIAGLSPQSIAKEQSGGLQSGLRLHRAHRILRIIGGPDTGGLCFKLDHLFPEYSMD